MRMNWNCEMRSEGREGRAAASGRGAPERSARLRGRLTLRLGPLGTPLRRITGSVIRDGGGGEASLKNSKISCTSRGTSNFCRWSGSIRKNIIGHRMRHGASHAIGHGTGRAMAVRGDQFLARSVFRGAVWLVTLLDQPAGKHGAGVFVDPLVEQSGKAREFIALERSTRSREKEFPRRLGWGTGHDGLLGLNACK